MLASKPPPADRAHGGGACMLYNPVYLIKTTVN